MGLDDLLVDEDDGGSTDDTEDSSSDSGDSEHEPSEVREAIENNIREKALNNFDDIEIHDGKLKGHVKDFAMMFALIGMEYTEVDLDDLAGKE